MTAKENLYRYYHHQTFEVMPLFGEGEHSFYPVNGFLERPPMNGGGKDWFGCEWIYSELAGAPAPSMEHYVLDDICNWREKVIFPDLDALDWKKAMEEDQVAAADREHQVVNLVICTGIFERLHTLMGFEESLMAMITDPEEVEAFFDRMTEYKIELIEKLHQYYNPDVITFHDDWGTQKAMFFSPELWRQLLKPRMKKIVDKAHECGIAFLQHSCGKMDEIIPDICEIGVDVFQCMDINDIGAALEKTGDKMCYQVSVHSQLFESMDKSGQLTEEIVREMVHKEFMEWGATGKYDPLVFPPQTWYEKVVMDEFLKCREELRGTYK